MVNTARELLNLGMLINKTPLSLRRRGVRGSYSYLLLLKIIDKPQPH
jgi:hypothetical protein